MNLVRVIVRGMGNLPTNFAVSGTFHFRHYARTPVAPRNLVTMTLTLEVMALPVMHLFMLQLYTKFEVRRPSNSANMTHFRSQH